MVCWYEFCCYECNKVNLVCDGDTNDQTRSDLRGFNCWCCGVNNKIDEDGEVSKSIREQWDLGYPRPIRIRK